MIPLKSQNQLLHQLMQFSAALCKDHKFLFSVIVKRLSHTLKNGTRYQDVYVNVEKDHIEMVFKRKNISNKRAAHTTSKNDDSIKINDSHVNTCNWLSEQNCKLNWSCTNLCKASLPVAKDLCSKLSKCTSGPCAGNLLSFMPIHNFTISQNAKLKQCLGISLGVSNTTSFGNPSTIRGRCISTTCKVKTTTEEEKTDKSSSSKDDPIINGTSESKLIIKILECVTAVGILIILLSFALVQTGIGSLLNESVSNNAAKVNVTFNDIKGIESAKRELQDMVQFLKNPEKFLRLGAKLPKGVLLVGHPGTGKTLLARAVAAEANVPFFPASGSEFDGVLVGQGARKVKELFSAAKQNAPAVIFIDEIDSVGRHRTSAVYHPFANQTINQLLTEMDGFTKNESVIILGATNRINDIDPALLRAGRFDVQIYVPMPDYAGRKEILDFYLQKVIARDIDLDYLARSTFGFSSAGLENLVNQAAIRAAILNAEHVTMEHLEYAREKVTVGPEGKLQKQDEEQILRAAYHEAGHALVALHTKDALQVHKITIVPHGLSLGHVAYRPMESQYETKAQMKAQLDTLVGGRVAEELIYGPEYVTSNASDDLKKANEIAERMVQELGMSEKIGVRVHVSRRSKKTDSTSESMEKEVSAFLDDACERARKILQTHKDDLDKIAKALIEKETMTGEELKALLNMKVESHTVKSYESK